MGISSSSLPQLPSALCFTAIALAAIVNREGAREALINLYLTPWVLSPFRKSINLHIHNLPCFVLPYLPLQHLQPSSHLVAIPTRSRRRHQQLCRTRRYHQTSSPVPASPNLLPLAAAALIGPAKGSLVKKESPLIRLKDLF